MSGTTRDDNVDVLSGLPYAASNARFEYRATRFCICLGHNGFGMSSDPNPLRRRNAAKHLCVQCPRRCSHGTYRPPGSGPSGAWTQVDDSHHDQAACHAGRAASCPLLLDNHFRHLNKLDSRAGNIHPRSLPVGMAGYRWSALPWSAKPAGTWRAPASSIWTGGMVSSPRLVFVTATGWGYCQLRARCRLFSA
jgi:hypothetical protein